MSGASDPPVARVALPALRAQLALERGGSRVGADRIRVLEAIAQEGSISAAARVVGLSYRGAQDAVAALNALVGRPLVQARAGGRAGGAARVTPAGAALVLAFRRLDRDLAHVAGQLDQHWAEEGGEPLDRLAWRLGMKTSARNSLSGLVESVTDGAVNAEVVIRVGETLRIVAVVTRRSVEELALAPGREAMALIKASFVILAAGHAPLAISARNRFLGTVAEHREGAVNDEVVLELEDGAHLVATVTRASGEALGLEVGAPAQALVKASHVIVAVD